VNGWDASLRRKFGKFRDFSSLFAMVGASTSGLHGLLHGFMRWLVDGLALPLPSFSLFLSFAGSKLSNLSVL